MGLDPVIEDIPFFKDSIHKTICAFYEDILNNCIASHVFPSCVKPNFAFYAQYGMEGILALNDIIKLFHTEGFPVILDVKRGDIGKTAQAYARESFEFFDADAVTLSPYLGYDSVEPFTKNYPDKGCYILVKTSNKSSADIQDLTVNGEPLYVLVAKKYLNGTRQEWGLSLALHSQNNSRISLTSLCNPVKDIPVLIPGIGTQGGDGDAVLDIIKNSKHAYLYRINASSSINYAYKNTEYNHVQYAVAAVEALKKLNDTFGH
jgi:orotidine-5'-phosphate decarboxylase